jgi:glycosyltransferase involved in cell wall biosynthesis
MSQNCNPWLSILIPVYNVEPWLKERIQSVLDQGISDIEIIMVDDGSTDRSLEIATAYRDAFPDSITLIPLAQNSGLSQVRNVLMNAARGEFIWFLDSDDYLLPGSLAALQKIIGDDAPDIISCNFQNEAKRKNAYHGPANLLSTDRTTFVSGVLASRKLYSWLKIFRRSIWPADLVFPTGKHFEDVATVPLLLMNANSFYHTDAIWVFYRRREGSILSDITRDRRVFNIARNWDIVVAVDKYADAIDENFPVGKDRDTVRFWASHFIACEFTKCTWRIVRCGKAGNERDDLRSIIYQFWEQLNRSSPIPFSKMLAAYRKRGNWGRYALLQICCSLAHWGEKFDVLP